MNKLQYYLDTFNTPEINIPIHNPGNYTISEKLRNEGYRFLYEDEIIKPKNLLSSYHEKRALPEYAVANKEIINIVDDYFYVGDALYKTYITKFSREALKEIREKYGMKTRYEIYNGKLTNE